MGCFRQYRFIKHLWVIAITAESQQQTKETGFIFVRTRFWQRKINQ